MNIQAEKKIIGYFLLDEKLIEILQVDKKLFQGKLHQEIYEKIVLLEGRGQELSTANLISELNRTREEDVASLINEMSSLAFETYDVFELEALVKELEEAYQKQQCLELSIQIHKIAIDKTLNSKEVMVAVKENVDSFMEGISLDEKYFLRYIAEGFTLKLDALKTEYKTIPTGINKLDNLIQGFAPKELIILGGRPSEGKTNLGLEFADNVAKQGNPVVFFSAEMPLEALASRYLIKKYFERYSIILPARILSGLDSLNETEACRIMELYEEFLSLPLLVQDKPGSILNLTDIKNDLLSAKKEYGQIGLVVIDYLQMIAKPEAKQQMVYAIGDMLSGLKRLAYEFNCPFLLLAQLGRASASRNEKRPYVSDLSDSGHIERYADKILLLYRESKYNQEADPRDLEIIVAKNRTGIEGKVKCSFDMSTGILKEMEN